MMHYSEPLLIASDNQLHILISYLLRNVSIINNHEHYFSHWKENITSFYFLKMRYARAVL